MLTNSFFLCVLSLLFLASGSAHHHHRSNTYQEQPTQQPQQEQQPSQPSTDQSSQPSTSDLQNDCLSNINNERANQGKPALTWDDSVAQRASASANYCCNVQPQQSHSDSGPGTDLGQNLFISHTTCSGAMYETNPYGWVTGERDRNGGHWENIIGGYTRLGCGVYQDSQCSCIACDFGL